MPEMPAPMMMPQGGPAAPGAGAAPQLGETVQASPEEQALYERFIARAYDLVYSQEVMPKVLALLGGGGDPVEGLASATAMVIGRVLGAAEAAGQNIPGDVLLHAGTAVFEDLASLAVTAGIADFDQDRDKLETAYFRALDMVRTTLQESGKMDQASAKADLDQLMAADQDGRLEQMFRGLADQDRAQFEGGSEGEDDLPPGLMPRGGAPMQREAM